MDDTNRDVNLDKQNSEQASDISEITNPSIRNKSEQNDDKNLYNLELKDLLNYKYINSCFLDDYRLALKNNTDIYILWFSINK